MAAPSINGHGNATKLPTLNAPDILPNATKTLAQFTCQLKYDDIPVEVVDHAKLLILDNIGVILYGSLTSWTKILAAMAETEGAKEVSTVFGFLFKTSPALAALVNGTAGHGFEFDEIHREGGIHPGSIIIPVVLAVAEMVGGIDGRDAITAVVAGYEVGTRVGIALGSATFFRGFHPQGSTGVFSATAAAASVLKLTPEQTVHAFGIAGSQAAGLMAAQEGAMVKRLHAGKAAQTGIYSALLARDGFTGIPNVLEASFGGFLTSFGHKSNPEALIADLGQKWETAMVGYKPYPTVASIHTALDGLQSIIDEYGITAEDVEKIEVGTSTITIHHCAWEYKPLGLLAAQMNLFYSMAMMLSEGSLGVDQFQEDRLGEPAILELVKRISAHVEPTIEERGAPGRHSAKVHVYTTDGRVLVSEQLYRRGSRENPAKPGEIEKKFLMLAERVISSTSAERLRSLLLDLEKLPNTNEITQLTRTQH